MSKVKITNYISPISESDTYPTHKAIWGLGGFKSVGSISERDNIPIDRREPGMWVNVTGDAVYEWSGNNWTAVSGISGIGGTDTNFANTNLTLSGARTHNLNNNPLEFLNNGLHGLFLYPSQQILGSLTTPPVTLSVETGGRVFITSDEVVLNGRNSNVNILKFNEAGGSNYVSLASPDVLSSNVSFVLPSSDGNSGNVLTTDGAGQWSWSNNSGTQDFYTVGSVSELTGISSPTIGNWANVTGDGVYEYSTTGWMRVPGLNDYGVVNIAAVPFGTDIGASIQQAIQDIHDEGRWGALIKLPPGRFTLSTPVVFDQSIYDPQIVVEGAGQLATTLVIPTGMTIIGFDMRNCDEAEVRNIRIIEDVGTRTSACFVIGGTSPRVSECWVGNAKYGYYIHGAGVHIENCLTEFCNANLHISARHFDSSLGIPTGVWNARDVIVSLDSFGGPLNVVNYSQTQVTVTSGSLIVGDILTSVSNSQTAEILDITGSTLLLRRYESDNLVTGPFITATGGSGTIDAFSNNNLHNIYINALQSESATQPANSTSINIEEAGHVVFDVMSNASDIFSVRNTTDFIVRGSFKDTSGMNIENSNGILSTVGLGNALTIDADSTVIQTTGVFPELQLSSTGTNYISLKSPDTLTVNTNFVLPTGDGNNGNLLATDGNGNLSFANDLNIQQHIWTPMTNEAVVDLTGLSPSQTTTLTADRILSFTGTVPVGKDRTYYAEITHTGNTLQLTGTHDPASGFLAPTYSPYIIAFKLTSSGVPRFAGVI